MFVEPSDFPRLKGRAAEIRHVGKPLLEAAKEFLDEGNEQRVQIVMALQFSVRMEDILDETAGMYKLPPALADEFEDCAYYFLALNTALGRYFHQTQHLFHTTIKFHYLIHIACAARYLHPRLGWCYSGEDFMQKMKQLVASCHRGTPPLQVMTKVVTKYTHGMHFRLTPRHLWFVAPDDMRRKRTRDE